MVQISAPWPTLSPNGLNLYFATDPLLSHTPTLIFHGPSVTTNSTLNSSRIQALILTPYGFQCFPRITISPNSSLYSAVKCLPQDQQGDEICRGLAVSLLKYFSDIPGGVRETLIKSIASSHLKNSLRSSGIFTDVHVGDVVSRMAQVHNVADVMRDVQAALEVRSITNVDLDVILPAKSISKLEPDEGIQDHVEDWESHVLQQKYGDLASLIRLFGTSTFIPTSRVRRAPSRPNTLNRSKSLLKKQEDSIRREIRELFETEERYVGRVRTMVTDFTRSLSQEAQGPHALSLRKLLPPSLSDILDVNSAFLDEVRLVLEAAEAEPGTTVQGSSSARSDPKALSHGRSRDITGALALSKAMLEWFPKFERCYADYMRASNEHAPILSKILRDTESGAAQVIRQIGEQQFRSLLIEPVQRLPRYSLFIDNITNQLPITNPALQPLLRCRDIITNICCMESPDTSRFSQVAKRLRNVISGWPVLLEPKGRLITATDVTELLPPYRAEKASGGFGTGILLLFSDCLVFVQKTTDSSLTARGVIAEIDRPSMETMTASFHAATGVKTGPLPLSFQSHVLLKDIEPSESNANSVFWMVDRSPTPFKSGQQLEKVVERGFHLHGSFEGKASRWTEDITKARIESRFSEQIRESDLWELRTVHNPETSLSLFTSISEGQQHSGKSEGLPRICLVVNDEQRFANMFVDDEGQQIAISVVTLADEVYRIELRGLNGFESTDTTRASNLVPVLCQRLGQSFCQQKKPFAPAFLLSNMAANQRILNSLDLRLDSEAEQPKARARPQSPVKKLSHFLSGQSHRDGSNHPKDRNNIVDTAPTIRPSSRKGVETVNQNAGTEESVAGKVSIVANAPDAVVSNPMQRLEDTFAVYIMALHGRRGSITGRALKGRSSADELAINEIYNSLLNDAQKTYTAMEASADVLLAAFEKFLKVAWKDRMGALVPISTLSSIRDKSEILVPADFREHFRVLVAELAPQNQRSLGAVIKLLADLLDGASNDGDKGALTASFAELLVQEGNPHEYISLLDRVVEDCDNLFEAASPASGEGFPSTSSSVNSSIRTRSVNTPSLNSNTSSLRKKLGFGTLTKENSKLESESKKPSVWRTLSKTARNAALGENHSGNASKPSLVRSKSTDIDTRMLPPPTPQRERPTVLGAFAFESPSRPGSSSANSPWGSVYPSPGSNAAQQNSPAPRRKRRSSLSDLQPLKDSPVIPPVSSMTRRDQAIGTSVPHARPAVAANRNFENETLRARGSPSRNKDFLSASRGTLVERAGNIQSEDTSFGGELTPANASTPPPSNIPTFKGGTGRRPKTSHAQESSSKALAQPNQRLKLQSPQKLRQRLQIEQLAIQSANRGLEDELAKIGEEMSEASRGTKTSLQAKAHPVPTSFSPKKASAASPEIDTRYNEMSRRLASLEASVPAQLADITSRTTVLQNDLSAALAAAETKALRLDELYRETNAENEALYERFNLELENVVSAMKRGRDEMGNSSAESKVMEQVKNMGQEVAKWRNEVGKLRRENVGLVARVKGLEEGRKGQETQSQL
ncbi:MAG: hypothetical protein M4579_001296 [Chaenotheca gracillima]|nr:MAG: hypothetical protein M4579_001296 [Chaenotheca gracillima]